ncbi:alpha-tocopherol transfer protein-like isoform X2 [Haematobia irritans]|uniref:alpha-tocopherol transfer protein-like isoform X2 n=1 Tax=Haematobia irritans TaxID=7368 RepID=UPI003F50636D
MDICGNTVSINEIDHLQKWFEENKNLPQKIDRIYLKRFYIKTKGNLKETKMLIEANYSLRCKHPNVFFNRDPQSEEFRKSDELAYFASLPALTPENHRVTIIKLKNTDPQTVNFAENVKHLIMFYDYGVTMPDRVEDDKIYVYDGIIHILDVEGVTMRHAAKASLFTLATILKYFQKYCPCTLMGLHFINCPSYINKLFAVIKPFMKKEFIDKTHFHTNGLGALYDYVPREILFEEYGGNAGKLSDISEKVTNGIRSKRDYIMDPNYWLVK